MVLSAARTFLMSVLRVAAALASSLVIDGSVAFACGGNKWLGSRVKPIDFFPRAVARFWRLPFDCRPPCIAICCLGGDL